MIKTILAIIVFIGCSALFPATAHLLTPSECVELTVKTIQLFSIKEEDDDYTAEQMKEDITKYWERTCKDDSTKCFHKDLEDLKRSMDIIDLVYTDGVTELLIGGVYKECMDKWRANKAE